MLNCPSARAHGMAEVAPEWAALAHSLFTTREAKAVNIEVARISPLSTTTPALY